MGRFTLKSNFGWVAASYSFFGDVVRNYRFTDTSVHLCSNNALGNGANVWSVKPQTIYDLFSSQ